MTHLADIPAMCAFAARLMQPEPRPARLDSETGTRGRASCLAEWMGWPVRVSTCERRGHKPISLYHVGCICGRCGIRLGIAVEVAA